MVGFQSSGLDYMTRFIERSTIEPTIFEVHCNSRLAKCGVDFILVMHVLLDIFTEDDNVINVH